MADFLGRWSRRKLEVKEGKPLEEPAAGKAPQPAVPPLSAGTASGAALDAAVDAGPQATASGGQVPSEPPLPTLADVKALTHHGDFKPFMAQGVPADVKNAAMKKLFADPHYNVMDRLDTYIDDYSKADPIPQAMLRQMVGSRLLGLFDETGEPDGAGNAAGTGGVGDDAYPPGSQAVATSYANPDIVTPDNADPDTTDPDTTDPDTASQPEAPSGARASQEPDADTDLRLQPDDAAAAPGAGRRA